MNQNNLLETASFSPKSLQFPNAWVGHLPFAAWVMKQVSPKIFVELGTHSGNSYFSFCQSAVESSLSSKCYAVDTWQGDEHAGEYSDEIFAQVNAHNQEHYVGLSRLLRMTFDEAISFFLDTSIDLLHIDGLHTYEAVRHDFESWLPKLSPGAVVIFHDTNVYERDFGVWKLWKELQARYPNNLEFVHGNGLGVLQLNNSTSENSLDWLQPNYSEKSRLINYFSALGLGQLTSYDLKELRQQVSTFQTESPLLFIANLFWTDKENEDFTENKQLLGQQVSKNDGITIIDFNFSESAHINSCIEKIRIDPISDQKPFFLVSAEILDATRQVIWSWTSQRNNNDEFENVIFIKHFESKGSFFHSTNNDPHWYPYIDESTLSKVGIGCTFRLSLIIGDQFSYINILQSMHQDLLECDSQIVNLKQVITDPDAHIANLTQAAVERDAHIANLSQALVEQDANLNNLLNELIEKNNIINEQQIEKNKLFESVGQAVKIHNP